MKIIKVILLVFLTVPTIVFGQGDVTGVSFEIEKPFYFNNQKINIGFQLYDIEGIPTKSNELVYVVLKNKFNDVVELQKSFANEGNGQVQFQLTNKLIEGYYEIIAYTNHLLNFGPKQIARKRIAIYDLEDIPDSLTNSKANFIDFYPEGGHLVTNIPSKLVYTYSHSCDSPTGSILDGNDKISMQLNLENKEGIGSIFFNPEEGKNYKFDHQCDSVNTISQRLPKGKESGMALRMDDRNDHFLMILQANSNDFNNDSIIIQSYSGNQLIYESKTLFKKKGLAVKIDKKNLPKGLLNFRIFGENRKLMASRSIYNQMNLTNIEIDIDREMAISKKGEFSFNSDTQIKNLTTQIIPAQWTSQKIDNRDKQNENLPPFSLMSKSEDLNSVLDAFSITQDHYGKISSISQTNGKINVKEDYLFLRGNLSDSKPLPDTTELYLFIPGVNVVYQVKVDTTGFFEFPLLVEFYGKQKVPFYTFSEDHKFENPAIELIDNVPPIALNLTEKLPWYNFHKQELDNYLVSTKIKNVVNFYQPTEEQEFNTIEFDINDLVKNPDADFLMTEYRTFPTMEEVIKEVLNGTMLRKRKKEYILRMFSEDLLKVYSEPPFIFINNRPTKEVDEVLAINPADIERIQIFNRHQKLINLGPFGDGGLIIIQLKESAATNELAQSGNYVEATGINKPMDEIDIINPQSNGLPDMRSLLLWETNLEFPKGKVSIPFKTSDRPGKYTIMVQYIDENGNLGFGLKDIEVRFQSFSQSSSRRE